MNNALNRIVEQIRINADVELKRLQAENEKRCNAVVEHLNELVEQEQLSLNKKIDQFKQKLSFKAASENEVLRNKKILETKQKIVLQVKESVVEALCSNEGYFNFMERLIEHNLPSTGELILAYGGLDYEKFLENLKFKPNNALKIEKTQAFERGALISCADFDINLEVGQIVSTYISKFESEILAILTQASETRGLAL